jgi:8-oxo-dGTP pyrophosphatase MutT (NUDIX family)
VTEEWSAVRAAVERRTDEVLDRLERRWGPHERRDPFEYGPRHHDPETPPESAEEVVDLIGGIASVIVFYTPEHRETVLVYNRSGGWEPPGGVIEDGATPEETARTEAEEETGLTVELTDLACTRSFTFAFPDGKRVRLPLAQFVGHRVEGTLSVEREGRTHPGTTRATGLFDRETLPETRRDRDLLADLLNAPPEWDAGE